MTLPAAPPMTDAVKTLVWMTDTVGNVTYLSRDVRHLFTSGTTLSFAAYMQSVHPDDRQRVMETFGRATVMREEFQIDYRVIGADGSLHWVTGSGAPRFDAHGEFSGYTGALLDVTTRYEAIGRLEKSEATHRLLTENSSDLISHHAADSGIFLFASPSFERILGFDAEELVGKRSAYEFVHPEDRLRVDAEIARQMRESSSGSVVEFRARHKNGQYLWMSTNLKLLTDQLTGENTGAVAVTRDISAERQTREALQQSRNEMYSMLESIGEAFYAIDRDWRITYANRKAADFVGIAPNRAIGKRLLDVAPELLGTPMHQYFQQTLDTREKAFFEAYWEPRDAWAEVRVYPNDDGLSIYFHDISARRKAENAMRTSEQRLREVIEMTPAGYLLADGDGQIQEVNPALCRISGYEREELVGRKLDSLFATSPWDRSAYTAHGPASAQGQEAIIRHKFGNEVHVLFNGSIKRDELGQALSLTAFLTDITARKHIEYRLEHLATHDTLTGLPNRALLTERLQQMLAFSARDTTIGVLFVDLDRFKEVNDSFGHQPGDVLLCEVAQRFRHALRPGDVIARLGGDEFMVVAHCSEGRSSAAAIAEKLLGKLAAPIDIGAQHVFISASIGISMFPEHGGTRETLFQSADTAMYQAKGAGRNIYRFFEPEMGVAARTRMTLELSLRRALGGEEFEVYYQPRVDLKTMTVIGMEALLRWNHPELGQVPPMQFIPLAEERNLISPIGHWVLRQACRDTVDLMRKLGRPLRVSVNLSARQLRNSALPAEVQAVLDETGFPAPLLELELTESALVEDIEHSAHLLRQLKDLGVKIAVDDFGTGYSGLAYLRRFSLDVLKLDRSFVMQKESHTSHFDFIKAFVDLAHALKLSVVAEGVETDDTLQFLCSTACDEAQGYFIARPMPLAALIQYLRSPSLLSKQDTLSFN
ncbi:EAL domain-containing protein [Noviherbaspirillum pedocola]|uniref:EAL domain-containing protein n=1 Tax=Noviherbaspirillum pedocola TaxID=2801341 RepID=A0A934W759_9BURK|nr:EAL domain-containing protein [Noviherbaspirillum pedocola]MBK4735163.1 EAL domain-containing protein [Noviherbaspirillum pedocola]